MDPELAALEAEAAALDQQLNATVPAMQTPMYTPAPAAPAPGQLQSLIDQPTRAPTDVELGVARLRAMSPLERTAAELEGRKLLFQEGLSFGVLPKVGAAATSLKEALYGKPLTEAFGEATTQQDILKEYVRQKALEEQDLVLGMTGPELAGGLLSPIDKLYRPLSVARGAPLTQALATRGLNVAQAAGTGAGAAGLQTFLSTPGTVEERLAAAAPAAETGALFGGGFGGLGQAVSAATPKLQSLGRSARRSALGVTQADYQKTAGKKVVTPVDKQSNVYTLTEKGVDNVLDKGYLGDSFDPLAQEQNLQVNYTRLNDELDTAIKSVSSDSKTGAVKTPQFIDIQSDLQQGTYGSKSNQATFANKIKELRDDIDSKKTRKLEYIQELKKAYGTLYDPKGTSLDARFNRAIYHELQATIEKYVPEARSLNEDIQSLILTRPIIERRKAAASAQGNRLFNAIGRMTYTTGGLFGAGARLGGLDPLSSASLAMATRAAATPTGREAIGRALTGGDLSQALMGAGLRAGQLTSRPTVEPMFAIEAPVATEDKELAALEAEAKALDEQLGAAKTKTAEAPKVQVGKQDVSIPVGEGYAPPNLVKAIMQIESSFNPKALSPKGAAGLMQLMPGTARDLGVTDRFDPQQNVDAGSRYLAQQLKKFNSVELTAAAYNWGPRRVANAVAKLKAEGIPVTWENMVKEVKVPAETQNYVRKVTKLLQA